MEANLITLNLNDEAIDDFLSCPNFIYHNDLYYLPSNPKKVFASLARQEFYNKQQLFLLYHQNQAVGRIVARISSQKDNTNTPYGMLGFFEVASNKNWATQLLHAGCQWLKTQQIKHVIGPIDGDTWHRYRFNTGPFDTPPFLLEPYNPNYYAQYWENFGFTELEKYYSAFVNDIANSMSALKLKAEKARQFGYQARSFNIEDFNNELKIIYQISCQAFKDNFFYSEIKETDFIALYQDAKAIIDPSLIHFALEKQQQPVGFLFAFPDHYAAVKAMNGKKHLFAKLKFLLKKRQTKTFNMKSVAVLEQHKRHHIASLLTYHTYQNALKKHYQSTNLCLIKNDNPSRGLDPGQADLKREYKLYQYSL